MKWREISMVVAPHFLKAYPEARSDPKVTAENRAEMRLADGRVLRVERFNHGLAHSLRQGFLASDIVRCLAYNRKQFVPDSRAGRMAAWAARFIVDDSNLRRLELAAAFQRSGRRNEWSSSEAPKEYAASEARDVENFRATTASHAFAHHFRSTLDVDRYAAAIPWSNHTDPVARVLHAAHVLDLRRIIGFNASRIRANAARCLFGIEGSRTKEVGALVDSLWTRSGLYLDVTGDRDLVTRRGLSPFFFLQSAQPSAMVDALVRARGCTST